MVGVRSIALGVILGILATGCGGEDPVRAAAETICAGIDAEASDEVAFEEFERDVARERRDGMDEAELLAAVDAACGRALLAISASTETPVEAVAKESEAEPAPEEKPEVAFTDLEQVDWLDTTWMTDCTNEAGLQGVTLTLGDRQSGVHRPAEPALTPIYVVELDNVVYGDVTGDGHDDAIFVTQCVYASAEYFVEVWSHDAGGEPVHLLPPVHHFSKFKEVIDRVEVIEGTLRIHSHEGAPGDDNPNINGYPVDVVTDWTYEAADATWTATEIERTDTRPPPSPSPQSEVVDRFTDPQAPHIRDAFRLPSGNIYCGLLDGGDPEFPPFLSCDIRTGLNPIPGGEDCEGDWAGIQLPMQSSAVPDCRGDIWLPGGGPDSFPVLGYGQTWSYEEITCRSSESGLSCENGSGGGFSLARNSWNVR